MGQLLHSCARTTGAPRRAIQQSHASLTVLAARYGSNEKTVAKGRVRGLVHDAPRGPQDRASTVLTKAEEAGGVACRRPTRLPLDDCLYAWQPAIPQLSRSTLPRCYQRHGISRLPNLQGAQPTTKKFKPYPIGSFHVDSAEGRTEEGTLSLCGAIDRTSQFAYAELHETAERSLAPAFLNTLVTAVPYKLPLVLTDNGSQFCHPPRSRHGPTAHEVRHMFGSSCDRHGIAHRMTKPKHPWTHGQVERMNRTLKEATVNRDSYPSHDPLKAHLHRFVMAYNVARRLNTLAVSPPMNMSAR